MRVYVDYGTLAVVLTLPASHVLFSIHWGVPVWIAVAWVEPIVEIELLVADRTPVHIRKVYVTDADSRWSVLGRSKGGHPVSDKRRGEGGARGSAEPTGLQFGSS